MQISKFTYASLDEALVLRTEFWIQMSFEVQYLSATAKKKISIYLSIPKHVDYLYVSSLLSKILQVTLL